LVPLPSLPAAVNQITPHTQASGHSGGHSTGTGSSSNIVVDGGTYGSISAQISQIDAEMGTKLNSVATEIENMCSGDFILPQAVRKCMVVTVGLKNALSEYQSLTNDTLDQLKAFTNAILTIG
jgi:hypothetical protein